MNNLLSPVFWFNQRPGLLIPLWRNTLLASIAIFFILAVVAFLLKKRGGVYARLWERIFSFSSANTFVVLLLFFFNSEMIPVLSSRFWYVLWVIGAVIWAFFIIKYALSLPIKKKEIEKQREFEKYLPK